MSVPARRPRQAQQVFFSASLLVVAGLYLAAGPGTLNAATYEVGPGQPYPTIASVPSPAAGDVVNIHCGTYNEVRKWTSSGTATNPIVLRGVCSTARPVIDAVGQDVSGSGSIPRAAWQIDGAYYQIENLEFINARNGSSAAGIRVLNNAVTITNCKITYSDLGIMSSSASANNLLVQRTEIAYNGTGVMDGQTHNVYLTRGGTMTFAYCYIHDAVSGENFKSRAHYTQLFYNYIADSVESEVEGLDGADTVAANSNMTMIGNIIVSTPNRILNTTKFVVFGQDTQGAHNGTLYLINNTLIAGTSQIGFLRSSATNSAIVAQNNVFYGSDMIVQTGWTTNTSGSRNWMPATATILPGFTGTVTGTAPGFLNASQRDFHLTGTSAAINIGYAAPFYVDGSGVSHSAIPDSEYVHPLGAAARASDGGLDAGAYEAAAPSTIVTSSPAGRSILVDGAACVTPCTFQWTSGSSHTLSAATQSGAAGTQYAFSAWSDGGAATHTVTVSSAGTYTAQFLTQYFVTTSASPSAGGSITPASGWFNAGSVVPVTATAAAGYQFSGFSGNLSGTSATQNLTVSAPAAVTANFTLSSVTVSALTLAASSVSAGSSTTGTVTLSGAAPSGGATITLSSSDPASASLPASVTIAAGQSLSSAFTITTAALTVQKTVTLTATYNGSSRSAAFTINPATVTLTGLLLSPVTVSGGVNSTARAVISAAAPAGGFVVTLTSSSAVAIVPASVTIPAGATSSATFSIPTSAVDISTSVTISASANGVVKQQVLTVMPAAISSILMPSTLLSGLPYSGTVALTGGAPSGGAVITLTASNPSLITVPPSVTIPAGSKSTTVTVAVGLISTSTPITITASYNGVSKQASVTLVPAVLSGILIPASIVSGQSASGTVALSGTAPTGGAVITLTASNPSLISVPLSVTIPAGSKSTTVTVVAGLIPTSTPITITASYNGVSKQAAVTLLPASLSSVTVSATSITGGQSSTSNSILLSGKAPSGGAVVQVSSSDPSVVVPASVVVAAGQSISPNFTLTTTAVATSRTVTISASCNGVTKTDTITVNP